METFTSIFNLTDADLDGRSCLILTKKLWPHLPIEGVTASSRDIDVDVVRFVETRWQKGQLLLITDLSIKKVETANLLQSYVEQGYALQLIDHHPHAEWLNQYSWADVRTVDEQGKKTAATSMLLERFRHVTSIQKADALLAYAEIVRAYDTWDWMNVGKIENGVSVVDHEPKELNQLYWLIGGDAFEEAMLARLTKHPVPIETDSSTSRFLSEHHRFLLTIENQRIDAYIEEKKRSVVLIPYTYVQHGGHSITRIIAVVFAEANISLLGNAICQEREDVDATLMINLSTGRASLRATKPDVDVSEIAQHFAGNGHPKASGCYVTPELVENFVQPAIQAQLDAHSGI